MAEARPGEFRDSIVRADLIPAPELAAIGYLQEANRLFFHPLGLALSVRKGLTEDNVRVLLRDAGASCNDEQVDGAMAAVDQLGLTEPHVVGVHDGRDDPEGVVFDVDGNRGELTDEDSRAKAEAVRYAWRERAIAREHALGFVVQPVQRVGDPVADVVEAISGVDLDIGDGSDPEAAWQTVVDAVLAALGLVGATE